MRASVVSTGSSDSNTAGLRCAGLRSLAGRLPNRPRKTHVRTRGVASAAVLLSPELLVAGVWWSVASEKVATGIVARCFTKRSRQGAAVGSCEALLAAAMVLRLAIVLAENEREINVGGCGDDDDGE
ncbi:hypothetical protein B0T26DRAFT_712234 [Lasiosphaeria miniovina]|uniref:Uncharacterized protein n=1 Tax=Lasiosphaeria miniovina TaxID=1954250 RepID=A0AA40AM08_9PEZI|nr:uncharacterized protein B0T26DRAFT_712234 [Lasiosphaeria miniovina]KAK0718182.1 hypothetical protein B0T26DRAFT_712234 [Lasiosphaeria miniovina]